MNAGIATPVFSDCRAKAIELRLPLTHMLLYVDSDSLKPKE